MPRGKASGVPGNAEKGGGGEILRLDDYFEELRGTMG